MTSTFWWNFGSMSFDGRVLLAGKTAVDVPEKEAKVLRLLLEAAPHHVSKEVLLKKVFGELEPGRVDSAIHHLRTILKRATGRRGGDRHTYILTVHGDGYAFVHPVEKVYDLDAECDRALELWNDREPQSLWSAKRQYERALRRDRGFPRAHAALADCFAILASYFWLTPSDGAARARAAARKALKFDGSLAQPHATLGFVHSLFEHRWAAAEAEFQQALERAPDYGVGHHWYALALAATGQLDRALRAIDRAQQHDPSRSIDIHAATILYWARQYDAAEARCDAAVEMHPDFWYAHHQLAIVYEAQGRYAEALEKQMEARGHHRGKSSMIEAALARSTALASGPAAVPAFTASGPFHAATAYAAVGDHDAAFRALHAAIDMKDVWVSFLAVDPRVDRLRTDPRFPPLLSRLNLDARAVS